MGAYVKTFHGRRIVKSKRKGTGILVRVTEPAEWILLSVDEWLAGVRIVCGSRVVKELGEDYGNCFRNETQL